MIAIAVALALGWTAVNGTFVPALMVLRRSCRRWLSGRIGKDLDRTRDSDLPGAVQTLLLEKNMADFAASARKLYAEERWLQRALATSILGSVLGIVVVIAVRRAVGRPGVAG
ncbi:MAG: hypothetical protein IPK26_31490 [Planctomycetes bacterium]|nr:hypothetical protein [Planctomycetota bacterium]